MKNVQIRLEVTVDGETITYRRQDALDLFHLPDPGEPPLSDTFEFFAWENRMGRRRELIESLGVYIAEAVHRGLDAHVLAQKKGRIRSIAK